MPERKTLNEDLLYRGSSANLPRLHTCENKSPVLGFLVKFRVTQSMYRHEFTYIWIYWFRPCRIDLPISNLLKVSKIRTHLKSITFVLSSKFAVFLKGSNFSLNFSYHTVNRKYENTIINSKGMHIFRIYLCIYIWEYILILALVYMYRNGFL